MYTIDCSVVSAPQFPSGWKPTLEPATYTRLRRGVQLLQRTAIIRAPSGRFKHCSCVTGVNGYACITDSCLCVCMFADDMAASMSTLEFIDSELGFILKAGFLRLPALILAKDAVTASTRHPRFQHLNVTIRAATASVDGSSKGQLQQIAAAAAELSADWILILTDSLKPMEYWLWNLISPLLEKGDGEAVRASKSLSLNIAGTIQSAGLQHQMTVIGDGKVIALPYMLYRCEVSVAPHRALHLASPPRATMPPHMQGLSDQLSPVCCQYN